MAFGNFGNEQWVHLHDVHALIPFIGRVLYICFFKDDIRHQCQELMGSGNPMVHVLIDYHLSYIKAQTFTSLYSAHM